MTIPQVPEINPGQSAIVLPAITNPYLGIWWSTQTVSQVPENVMGWLVAQGYEVTGISQDNTTVPPTNYFALTREGMKPLEVLLSLCNSYTIAANEARDTNQLRYNEIVYNWTQMIDSSHDQFNAQTIEQNAQAGVFLTDLDTYMTAIETLISDNQSQMVTDAAEAKVALEAMDARLADLETNAQNSAVTIEALLSEQETNLLAYINDYDSRLAELDSNVAAHIATVLAQIAALDTVLDSHITDYSNQFAILASNYTQHESDIETLLASTAANVTTYVTDVDAILTLLDSDYQTVATDLGVIRTSAGTLVDGYAEDYQGILDLLESDYDNHSLTTGGLVDDLVTDYSSHSTIAGGLLTGLGATELARINEEFAANLAIQLQNLVTRGLYTSTLAADITERNHRDRDEQIQLLNDRLNREQLDNQHKLFEQQRVMRTQKIDNQNRLYEQQLGVRTRTLDGTTQLHSVRQEVLRYQASLISGVYELLQETRNRVLAGKQAIFTARDANYRLGIEVQSNLYSRLQDVRLRTIESIDRIYQLRDVFAKWENGETHRLYEQLQQVEQLFLEAVERQHTAKQEVTRNEISERDTLLQQLQTALNSLIGGKERFSTLLLQNASTLAEHKHRAIAERMDTAVRRLEGWKSIADENRALMAYQLDERNKLLIGLYSFVERRDDIAPEWKDMASMIAGLGDSGGGWIQP